MSTKEPAAANKSFKELHFLVHTGAKSKAIT